MTVMSLLAEYQGALKAERDKTEKLRALRLAKEAADAEAAKLKDAEPGAQAGEQAGGQSKETRLSARGAKKPAKRFRRPATLTEQPRNSASSGCIPFPAS